MIYFILSGHSTILEMECNSREGFMEWTFFLLGFVTGIGSLGLMVLAFALIAGLRGHQNQQKMASDAASTFQDIIAKAGTAAMMNRDGGSKH